MASLTCRTRSRKLLRCNSAWSSSGFPAKPNVFFVEYQKLPRPDRTRFAINGLVHSDNSVHLNSMNVFGRTYVCLVWIAMPDRYHRSGTFSPVCRGCWWKWQMQADFPATADKFRCLDQHYRRRPAKFSTSGISFWDWSLAETIPVHCPNLSHHSMISLYRWRH